MNEDRDMPSVRSRPIMERHLQTLLLTLVAGLIAWQGVTTLKLTEASARQDERLIGLTDKVTELQKDLREFSTSYYPKADAEREFGDIKSDISSLRERVTVLEGKSQ